jgi:hypothetical protein
LIGVVFQPEPSATMIITPRIQKPMEDFIIRLQLMMKEVFVQKGGVGLKMQITIYY